MSKRLRGRRQKVEGRRLDVCVCVCVVVVLAGGFGGLGSVEELWVNKARGGEEERDS